MVIKQPLNIETKFQIPKGLVTHENKVNDLSDRDYNHRVAEVEDEEYS